jgi:4-carboxymuconolactone decarboxylase
MSNYCNPIFSSSTPKSPDIPALRRGHRIMSANPNPHESRLERGTRALSEVDGKAGENVIAALADIAPDFARYLIEFPFGDIYSRPGLDLRAREIATIAALTAMGNAAPQLKVHIEAGLNVGLSRDELTEIIMQMAVYAGFPAALNGLFAAKDVFGDRTV